MAKYRLQDVKAAVRLTAEARRTMARLMSVYGDRPGMIVEWALAAYEPELTGVPTTKTGGEPDTMPLSTDLHTAVEVLSHGVKLLQQVAANQPSKGTGGELPVPRRTLPRRMGGHSGGGATGGDD